MLGRRSEVLRLGEDRLRLRHWAGEAGTGLLIQLTPGSAVSDDSTAAAVESAVAQGYHRLRTSALSHIESEPFLRAGFRPCQQLALLTRSIQSGLPDINGSIAIRRALRSDHPSVLAVDQAAFEPFWQLDQAGLRDALRATPFRHFRVVRNSANAALTGYAISGRSGPAGYLQRLAISPHHQGQGTGAALAIDGLRWMARWGATQAWVNTPQHHTGALRLYDQLGFELVPPGLQVLEMVLEP
ncbi:GNAT family N-acetyltransferase [Candidatus Poriferisocius sp.]|uniref:GNAT family N-acetyltransferase n=1 Tax=Candidatus Poriferisocius sp. TaxID=3101276 RepID=UPI003B5271E3